MGALPAWQITAEMISFYMPSNDPVVLQKVSLMKHIQMEIMHDGNHHAIYDKHVVVLFLNVYSVRMWGRWPTRNNINHMSQP